MRLETRTVKRNDPEIFGNDERNLQAQAKCPSCGTWEDVDADQLAGGVSLVCDEKGCGWHGYIDGRTA